MHRGNPARNGAVPGTGPIGDPVLLWQMQLPGPATRAPAIVDGVAYVGAGDGVMYALDALTGKERWQVPIDSLGDTTPTVVDGTVYFGSLAGTLYALDAETGEERWQFTGTISADSTPLVVDGTLYVGSDEGNLFALDAATGEEQWRYSANGSVLRSPSFAEGVIYAGTDTGLLFAIDAVTHETLWEFQGDPEELVGTSGVSDGVIYFHQAIMMWALDAKTGQVRWQREVNEGGVRCADPFQDLIVTCGADGQITGLDAATGDVRWTFMTGDNNQPGALVDGVLYVASFDRNVYAIDAATGKEKWHFPIDGAISYGPHVANGVVYVSTDLGSVYAIGGSQSAPGAVATPTAGTPSATSASVTLPAWAEAWLNAFVVEDPHAFAGLYTNDATYEEATAGGFSVHDRFSIVEVASMIMAGQNDHRFTPTAFFAGDGWAILEYEWSFTDAFTDQPVSGIRTVTVFALNDDGLIERSTDYYDVLAVETQLGMELVEAGTPTP
jgi:outer membrane protein assembly factor BamB